MCHDCAGRHDLKEYYGTGWQRGLTTLSEVWSGGVRQKWTTMTWTQDNTSVGYEVNPRVTETNVYDAGGNRRRTVSITALMRNGGFLIGQGIRIGRRY